MKREFNGARLKEARQYSRLSITELAKFLDVSKQMISKYENNMVSPSYEVMFKILTILKFPKEFYYEESNFTVEVGETFFRSNLTSSKKERKSQEVNTLFLSVIRCFFEKSLQFHSLEKRESIKFESIEDAAIHLRKKWELGNAPIKNMVRLLESKGFIVSSLDTNSSKVDAFGRSVKVNDNRYYCIVLENEKNSFYRRQFSAAHELAHWLLHDSIEVLDEMSHQEYKEMERQANEFASAFLLPKDSFGHEVALYPKDLNYYIELKKKWHVSIGAMVRRAFSLGVISVNQYEYLLKKMSFNGWRKAEPLDDIKKVRHPEAMVQAFQLLLGEGLILEETFADEISNEMGLSLHPRMIEELLGLECGTLKFKNPSDTNVIELTFRQPSME